MVGVRGKGVQGKAMRIQHTQRNGTERNQPSILVFRDAYKFSNQGLTHVNEAAFPLYLSVGTDSPHICERRVFDVTEQLGVFPRRGHIKTSWWHLPQSFMRSLCVIHREELITPFLLSLWICCRRLHDFLLESTMHAFMSTVLFRVSWLYALGHNPQLDPPHRQARQSTNSYRSSGFCPRR